MSEQPLAIETMNLTKRYGRTIAVDGLNLQVPRQAIYGFIGPNGAGKTTTLRMLAGLLEPSSGEIKLLGDQIDPHGDSGKLVGYMPDFFGVYDELRVWEYLDFFARCHGVPTPRRRATVDGLLDLVDLAHKRNDFVQNLSRGMQQRLCLAHALVHDPPILLLDEPASGLDPQSRVELRELLRTLRGMGKTVVLSSHILNELEDICTHIGIMAGGRLLDSGPIEELQYRDGSRLSIRLIDGHKQALEILTAAPGVNAVIPPEDGDRTIQVEFHGGDLEASQLLSRLVAAGISIADFHRETDTLERLFLRLVESQQQAVQ